MPEPSLRFCMVTTFYPPYHFGGDAIFVRRLARALASAGHHVDVVHSTDAYRLRRPVTPERGPEDDSGIVRYPLESASPRLTSLLAHQLGRPALSLARLETILQRDYDVIHYHNVSLMGAPGVLRLGRALKIYTAHEYWLVCPTHVLFRFNRKACIRKRCLPCTLWHGRVPQAWRYTRLLQTALEQVDALLMPSQFALERHRADGIRRPMVLLPHFVPDPAPVPLAQAPAGRPYFLYAGRLEKLKGVQDLIRVFADEPRADLLIAGEGSYRPSLQRMARGLPRVRFLGPLEPSQLGGLYARAVALLVPSLCYETFGLAAAEAMSHGTPVIVRRLGALREMVEQSEAGLTFETIDDCRAAVERLLCEPALRDALGARGRAAVQQHWSSDVHLARYLELVGSMRAAHSPARLALSGLAGAELGAGA